MPKLREHSWGFISIALNGTFTVQENYTQMSLED